MRWFFERRLVVEKPSYGGQKQSTEREKLRATLRKTRRLCAVLASITLSTPYAGFSKHEPGLPFRYRLPGTGFQVPGTWHLIRSDAEGRIPDTEDRAPVPGTRHLYLIYYPIPFPMSRTDFSVSGFRLSLFFSTGPVVPEVPTFSGSGPNPQPRPPHAESVPRPCPACPGGWCPWAPERTDKTFQTSPRPCGATRPHLFSKPRLPEPGVVPRGSGRLGPALEVLRSCHPGRASHTHDVEAGVHVEDRPRDGRGHIAQQEHGGPGDVLLRDVPPKGAPGLIDLQDAGKVADP